MGNLAKLFRSDVLIWIRVLKTAAFDEEISAEDAIATAFRWLEHGYQRAETALSRPEWLRRQCGYYTINGFTSKKTCTCDSPFSNAEAADD